MIVKSSDYTLLHKGKTIRPGTLVDLDQDSAKALIEKGFVKEVEGALGAKDMAALQKTPKEPSPAPKPPAPSSPKEAKTDPRAEKPNTKRKS
ncbi:hypothetical protein [Pseudobacteriovorax antillogorgiicola]|uniref:Uncharacterized protein n=1 Tax=Pseudobacteriovorax antillogorgiicola TaxID=1513793 RepID=A0A1Y6CQ62_9BACT|nr:hypothetical protein [Pseudobacteriovorax antillogorgiicola]TCS51638.1 hypothetical protein EDD56_11022 [Pseudobacteriovorax antillogorgiicola]SMF81614.1 hypothetical protein SAMN06296036_13722 [Pseudobacteriovorax antillogorgiicola]